MTKIRGRSSERPNSFAGRLLTELKRREGVLVANVRRLPRHPGLGRYGAPWLPYIRLKVSIPYTVRMIKRPSVRNTITRSAKNVTVSFMIGSTPGMWLVQNSHYPKRDAHSPTFALTYSAITQIFPACSGYTPNLIEVNPMEFACTRFVLASSFHGRVSFPDAVSQYSGGCHTGSTAYDQLSWLAALPSRRSVRMSPGAPRAFAHSDHI